MPAFICATCGTQYSETPEPPAHCLICEDERQYVGFNGQQWTTLDDLRRDHRNKLTEEEPGLVSIITEPKFGIGQRAFLVQTPAGNVLWDCLTLLDDETKRAVEARGGLRAIAISHPHYYTAMVEWSRAFGNVPVYLHAADRKWVMRPDDCVEFWEGDTLDLAEGLTLIRCGGHFAGGTVLHWPDGAEGRGALLSGDILQVVPDRRWVSFMYSYPNLIPLPIAAVRRIVEAVRPFPFDRIYGAFAPLTVAKDGHWAVIRSAERYCRALEKGFDT
jgi:glyoxylase-like metal-dependent hydrolase (beta-lactamase superfamily II)